MTRIPSTLPPNPWSAIGSMSMCVALLIASEFMPVSLLTPIAADLHITEGMAGQAISVSGAFAVATSLFITAIASRLDRRTVLLSLTSVMLASLLLIAIAPSYVALMGARALLGITVGGFWALSTATVMRLVPEDSVPKALGALYAGNAVATTFAAPIGSYFGSLLGWRRVFLALSLLVLVNLVWQWLSLPSLRSETKAHPLHSFGLLRRRNVSLAMVAVMLAFGGAFSTFTYLRPFLEMRTGAQGAQLSFLFLALGVAGCFGTYGASLLVRRHLPRLLAGLPVALGLATLTLLLVGRHLWPVALVLFVWGLLNSAIPVAWSNWLAQGIADDPEAGGGLMVAAIQLAIMLGAAFGGLLFDQVALAATWIAGALLLMVGALFVGDGRRLFPVRMTPPETRAPFPTESFPEPDCAP